MTEHKTNALIHESSPYLLQHARNPVDWMPWGEAAFAKAKAEDKLVFLSIGYATCHWCHVMERESFEDADVAALMNELFVCIKVDREERPDIDATYMAVTQALNDGRGGWPMSLWLTPDKQPVTAGTYFPPHDRFGRPGFTSIMRRVHELWSTQRERLIEQATHITEWLQAQGTPAGEVVLGHDTLRANAAAHVQRFDAKHGGFDGAPKFPTPHRVQSLLHWAREQGDAEARHMALFTLQCMADGGLHDHVGGGFHRYSTDREWLTPHFEKMLYDNALMIEAYLDAYLLSGDSAHADIVRDVATYVLRDLRDEAGGFHSAEDADSEGEEGKFYVWTLAELQQHLGDDADLAGYVFGCTERGNYHDEASGQLTGANILHLPRSLAQSASGRGLDESTLRAKVAQWKARLLAARAARVRPLLDDKVLTDWNGLMIAALARAGATLGEPAWVKAAAEAANFVLATLVSNGRLLHRYRKGVSGLKAYGADYAFLINGLIALYQADFDLRWLREADKLAAEMLGLFWHEGEGLLHLTGSDETDCMIAPHRETYDGAIPSTNSAAALALVRLGKLLQRDTYTQHAERILKAMSRGIDAAPAAHSYALMALEWLAWPTREVVIAAPASDATADAMVNATRQAGHPRTLLIRHTPGDGTDTLIPFTANQGMQGGKATAYVCENYACKAPVTALPDLKAALA